MDKKKKGGAGLGQGRKPKSGKYIQFRPSVEVWNILKDKPKGTVTAFIEESVLRNHDMKENKHFLDTLVKINKFEYLTEEERKVLFNMTFDTMKSDLNKLQEDLKKDLK